MNHNHNGPRITQIPKPTYDKEMLSFLKTLVKDDDTITKTLGLIKTIVTYEQNVKNLGKANKDVLAKTYGFLIGVSPEDNKSRSSRLKV